MGLSYYERLTGQDTLTKSFDNLGHTLHLQINNKPKKCWVWKETKAKRNKATQDQNLTTSWETPQETKP